MADSMNRMDWETLERDAERGFETLGREVDAGWEVEVRFDDATPPQSGTAATRDEARTVGQEIFMTHSP